jgi:hypothetical protein
MGELMKTPKVAQTWEIHLPADAVIMDNKLDPFRPGERFRVNIVSVNEKQHSCIVATPGMAWTCTFSFEFLSDAGTLVQDAVPTLEVKDFDADPV